MALRSSWEGFLKLNLISVPVKAYANTVSGKARIHFHQIHAGCGERIHHQKVCSVHGEVNKDEVVSGYEYTKGEYVIVEPEELAKMRAEDEKTVAIDAFVRPDAIDLIYSSGRTLYLTPDGKVAQQPYAVIQRVMDEQQRHAVARIVLSGREQIALLRPIEGLIAMTILEFDEQIKKPAAFKDEAPEAKLSKEEVELAESLVKATTVEEFDISQYHDNYEAELTRFIEAKASGKKVPSQRAQAPPVLNLMDALKKSLDQSRKVGKKQHAAASRSKRKSA
jgi:DNA end-binding protein Ku